MTVKRIVANIATEQANIDIARSFYVDVLGMTVGMDLGWIVTFVADGAAPPQVSVASQGGSGTPVPDLSVEVDDLGEVHARALAHGFAVEYGPVDESWRVRRFFVRDPLGRLVNVLAHSR